MPYANGPAECLHLLSVISPISDDLAVVFLPQLPAGLHELLGEHSVELVPVPEAELVTQGCNILTVRPGVVVMVEGNPVTQRALLDRGCEVHTFPGDEVCINGVRRPHLHHPPDPARMKNLSPAELAAVANVDRDRVADDLAALVAIPSLTGSEGEVQTEVALRMTTAGLDVERVDTPAIDLVADPDFPGVEVARDTHPVVVGGSRAMPPGGGC